MNHRLLTEMEQIPEIAEILHHENFLKLRTYTHHGRITRKDHTLQVAEIVFASSRRRGLDYISATRGALLHDFFFYNWRFEGRKLHAFKHPSIACKNAIEVFGINAIEQDAILRHMWPLTITPPRYHESMLVCMADKAAALNDYSSNVRFIKIPRIAFARKYN